MNTPEIGSPRVGVRFQPVQCTPVTVEDGADNPHGEILDFSLQGCGVRLSAPLRVGERVHARSSDTTPPLSGEVRYVLETGQDYRCGIQFCEFLRLERFGPDGRHLVNPCNDFLTRKNLLSLHMTLAKADVESLQASIRDLKSRKFQIMIMGIPLIMGLIGTTISQLPRLVETVDKREFEWLLMLPMIAVYISYPLLEVFLHKLAASHRHGAFLMLLQRYMAVGVFPPGYRGWEDAVCNYARVRRFGVGENKKLRVRQLPEPSPGLRSLRFVDTFNVMTGAFLMLMPCIATLLMIIILSTLEMDLRVYGFVVGFTTFLTVLCSIYLCARAYSLYWGVDSFNHLLIQFSKILKYASPYDPVRGMLEERSF